MLRIRTLSIATKLTMMSTLVSAAALVITCLAFVAYDAVTFRDSMIHNLSIQAQMAGSNSVSPLLFNDPRAAENTLSALKAAPRIMSAGIYTPDGRPFAAYWRDGGDQPLKPPVIPADESEVHWLGDGQLALARSIDFQGRRTGIVYIRSDLEDENIRLRRYSGIAAMVLLASLLAALLLASMVRRGVAEPIVSLAQTARIVSREKNYAIRVRPNGNRDEPDILIGAFNEMLEQIQERDGALQKAHDELERNVQERTAQLAATNRELEAFTYSVAHDLRAPLRHIDGFSRIVLEDHGPRLDAEGRRNLERIRDATQHMGHLVDDLLNLARVGRQELKLQITGLDSLVKEVVAGLEAETGRRQTEWRIASLPFVECDPGLMKQVLANLLSNALKYTRPRECAVIEVGQMSTNGEVVFFVRDNGVGFNMKYADKLFGAFQRLHRPEDFEGTGVGLAIVQRIIHKHGGRIWAEAELDKGAAFYFTLGSLSDAGQRTMQTPGEEAWQTK